MNKLAANAMRHWPTPNFGMSRSNMGMPGMNPPPPQQQQQKNVHHGGLPISGPPQPIDTTIHYSFNVPLDSDLPGPDTEEILHATPDAVLRWTHPEDAADDVPVYELPVHVQNLGVLRRLCSEITLSALPIEAHVLSSVPKNARGQVTTVVLSGQPDMVYRTRETVLNEIPISLRCATVEVEGDLVADLTEGVLKANVIEFLDQTSKHCGVDIFLLGPTLKRQADPINGVSAARRDERFRLAIYGDLLSSEHAKTRVLIHIDQMLGRILDAMKIEHSTHQLICGRNRKNIKTIESQTNTAIYFPPPFAQMYRYCPPNAKRRDPAEIYITGESMASIMAAKNKVYEILMSLRLCSKEAVLSHSKIDSILLSRLDKVRKIIEANGTYIMFPVLGTKHQMISVQAAESVFADRTLRELTTLAGQFYMATWWHNPPQHPDFRSPNPEDIRTMLGDICANSGADVGYEKNTFTITGSDEAVKAALDVISRIKFVAQCQYSIKVKIELSNEHKEFVSGKKNGKINKIMSASHVQILFDNFSEYNFNIDVTATTYDCMKNGLTLVEQEMPASISFHVPDQYHKRIIGIGGQHIQRIMKKYSVFVKFSNAMERGGMGREEEDISVDNVICRTPARNAENLEAVKTEILEMVDREDTEFTTQQVSVDRLYHRKLLSQMKAIESLESRWNCKIQFPSTEEASDEVTVTGPQWRVPNCVDALLALVPDNHELVVTRTPSLVKWLESPEYVGDIVPKLKTQYEIEVAVTESQTPSEKSDEGETSSTITLLWTFTRNNAGGLRDAIEFFLAEAAKAGTEIEIVKGSIPRPKSDTFEASLQYFDSKLLSSAASVHTTDSPTKASFGDEVARERNTLFDRLRKPGSMSSISSFLDRRKNSSHTMNNSFFKGSNNASKASLISIESTRSFNADRNPWNDSGVNLPEEDNNNPWAHGRSFPPTTSTPTSTTNGHEQQQHNKLHPGDATPRHAARHSGDSGRPSTSHSVNTNNSGYPGPGFGPFR